MIRSSKIATALSPLLVVLLAVPAAANLISYSTWPDRRDKLMVVDEEGGIPVELLVMSKGSFPTGGSISPAGLEETWIVFNELENIYKIRPDGSDQTLVLCAPVGNHPLGWGDPIWSPDGSEILVTPYSESDPEGLIALIPADRTAGETCDSGWTEIYDFTSPWTLDSLAWNHDGSRIAFTESNGETEESHLVVIERQASGTWEPIGAPILVDPEFSSLGSPGSLGFSWRPQAGSGLLIFRQRNDYLEPGVCCWLGSVDLATEEWSYVLDGENPIPMHVGSRPKWSPNGEEILYTDPDGDLVVWNYLNGSSRVVGSGTFAHWQRGTSVPDCSADADCGTGYICCSGNCIEPKCVSDALCEEIPPDVCTDDFCNPCSGCSHELDPSNDPSCVTTEVDCGEFDDKKPCNAELTCRWDNRSGTCVDN